MVAGTDGLTQTQVVSTLENDRDTVIPSKWFIPNHFRFDASYYTREAFTARAIIDKYSTTPMPQLVTVSYPGRFKRIYSDSANGLPFLSASDALFFRPTSTRWLSRTKVENIDKTLVKQGWICITRSGTVGRPVYVTERLTNFALSDDLLRIIPLQGTKIGFLYAFFSTWIGQTLLARDQYGSAIKHLEPEHVLSIPVPNLPDTVKDEIQEQVLRAQALREEANQLIDRCQAMLLTELELPPLSSEEVSKDKLTVFSINLSEINLRFDATFHDPLLRTIAHKMKAGRFPVTKIRKLGKVYIPPRFARTYVKKAQGIPFLQGKQMMEIKPFDLKYISKKVTKNIDRWLIHQGIVLVACSGTVGRTIGKVGLVPKIWDGWAATQHLLRIIPFEAGDEGYLAAFLMNPYGYHQLIGKTYGGAIAEIAEDHVREIFIPDAAIDVKKRVGQLATEAFELKEQANSIENSVTVKLESELEWRK